MGRNAANRETNIGIDPVQIRAATKVLLDDASYRDTHETFPATERAVRLDHRLVSVHLFRNGNGRHARFMADLYLRSIGLPRLTWGGRRLDTDGEGRKAYLDALRVADRGEIDDLVEFARS